MNRNVIITGSTRGIGFATAEEFLKDGDRVAIFCRHQAHVREAAKGLTRFQSRDHIRGLR